MKSVWKTEHDIASGPQNVDEMPDGSRPVAVGWQKVSNSGLIVMRPVVWWEVPDTKARKGLMIDILVVGTGHEIPYPDDYQYIGTLQDPGAPLVWHFYWRTI